MGRLMLADLIAVRLPRWLQGRAKSGLRRRFICCDHAALEAPSAPRCRAVLELCADLPGRRHHGRMAYVVRVFPSDCDDDAACACWQWTVVFWPGRLGNRRQLWRQGLTQTGRTSGRRQAWARWACGLLPPRTGARLACPSGRVCGSRRLLLSALFCAAFRWPQVARWPRQARLGHGRSRWPSCGLSSLPRPGVWPRGRALHPSRRREWRYRTRW